jgi:hypothetical protein
VSKTDTRQSIVCRVLAGQHSTKYILKILKQSLLSARQGALNKDIFAERLSGALGKDIFAECQIMGTRQSIFLNLKKSSVRSRALGKEHLHSCVYGSTTHFFLSP